MPTDANEVVRAISVLRGVPHEELLQLASERLELEPGAVLFAQGTSSDCVYGVLTGRLKIVKRAGPDRELCLEVLGPGEPVAAVAVIRKVPLPAAAVALERTAVLKIPAEAFRRLMERHPLVSARMLDMISKRLLEAGHSRLELATQPVEVRLARALLRLGEKFGERRTNEWVFSQNITRQNLADLAGTTVESAIRVMSAWTKAGIVRSTHSRITIADVNAVERIATGDAAVRGHEA